MTNLNAANELMLSYVWRYLPTPLHNAYVCSSGTRGYCSLKDTLQNGKPGHTLFIESTDLRDVESSEGQCCLVYIPAMDAQAYGVYSDHIPPTITHVTVYGNVTSLPSKFVQGCSGLISVDLSPLTQVTEVQGYFLSCCINLKSVNLSPLSQVTEVHVGFLGGCSGLTSVDLTSVSQIKEVREHFLLCCCGLTSVDLSPLSQVTVIHAGFLLGCTGLTSIDLSPLSQVGVVKENFLSGCTSLKSVNLSPLSLVTVVLGGFLRGCPQITAVDKIPPLCADPPHGWLLKESKWIQV